MPDAAPFHQARVSPKPVHDEETLTAYHEAGHAVIGFALGARIESVQLWGEADDFLPARFGDCRVNWGRIDPNADFQRQREVLTILAGPVAEMVYTGDRPHPALFGPWQGDWLQANQIADGLVADLPARTHLLEKMIVRLHQVISSDGCWAAIAAVADELAAHDLVEEDRIQDIVGFWLRQV